MAQSLIRLVGGPFNGSRVPMPPAHMLGDGRTIKLRGDQYTLEYSERLGELSKWEAHHVDSAG